MLDAWSSEAAREGGTRSGAVVSSSPEMGHPAAGALAAWQQEEGGARHWVGSGKGKKTDWYSRGGGVKLLQKKPAAAAETAVTGGAPLFSSREEEEED